jgi:hypothetical protein
MKFHDAVEKIVRATLGEYQRLYGQPQFEIDPYFYSLEWQPSGLLAPVPGIFLSQPRESVFTNLREWDDLLRAAAADEHIGPQMNNLVGHAFHRMPFDLERIVRSNFVGEMVVRTRIFDFDSAVFEELYATVEAELRATGLREVAWVPLFGFDATLPELDLPNGFRVRKLSSGEIQASLDTGTMPLNQCSAPPHTYHIDPQNRWGITHETLLPKIVAPGSAIEESSLPERVDIERVALDLVTALRLVCGGAVTHGIALRQDRSPVTFPGRGWSFRWRQITLPSDGRSCVLNEGDVSRVHEVMTAITTRRVQGNKALQTAIRRLRDCVLKLEPEDRLVDLVIAAEALYLSDVSGDISELSHRASLRAALFSDHHSRDAARKFMKRAYEARSKVAHGKSVETNRLVLLDGSKPSLAGFIDELEGFMRAAVTKATRMVADNHELNWERWESAMLAGVPGIGQGSQEN